MHKFVKFSPVLKILTRKYPLVLVWPSPNTSEDERPEYITFDDAGIITLRKPQLFFCGAVY